MAQKLGRRRRWDLLASHFTELLKRLESRTFPNRDDWVLVLSIGTIAEEVGKPKPVRMSVENWEAEGPHLRLVSHGIRPLDFGPTAVIGLDLFGDTAFPVRDDLDRDEAERCLAWDNPLADVATFLSGTWLPFIELIRPIDLTPRSVTIVEQLAKVPGGMKGADLSKKIGLSSDKNLGRTLAEVVEKGLVENERDGFGYRLTRVGHAWASAHLSTATERDGPVKGILGSVKGRDGKLKVR